MSASREIRFRAAEMLKMSPEERVRMILSLIDYDGKRYTRLFSQELCKLKSLEVLPSNTARGTYTFKVDPFYCNGSGNLHGGAQSAFFDMCTSLILQALDDAQTWMNGGVSRTLNVSYLRPAPAGIELEMDCEVVHAGKNMCMLRGVLRRASDGAVISTCEHNKAAVKEKPQYKI